MIRLLFFLLPLLTAESLSAVNFRTRNVSHLAVFGLVIFAGIRMVSEFTLQHQFKHQALNTNNNLEIQKTQLSPKAPIHISSRWLQHARVFTVGVLKFNYSLIGWPDLNRQDKEWLNDLKRRKVHHVEFISNENATTQRLENHFERFVKKIPKHAPLIFYYTGHGSNSSMSVFDSAWKMSSVWSIIGAHFKGPFVVIHSDTCNSGAHSYWAKMLAPHVPIALLTSVINGKTSTGTWDFTQYCLRTAYGGTACDLNHDGKTFFVEAAEYCRDMMMSRHGQEIGFYLDTSLENLTL